MAADETNLDFDWRDPTNQTISNLPRPLRNQGSQCYRNVIFTWLFHTPVLLNWIADNHGPWNHGEHCFLCRLRELATRFWAINRVYDSRFDGAVDQFWRDTHHSEIIENLDQQNDVEEYMRSLLVFLEDNSDPTWIQLILVQKKECVKICEDCSSRTHYSDDVFALQGTISGEDGEYQPLCRTLRFNKLEDTKCNECNGFRQHKISYGLLDAPPILVIHCQPHIYRAGFVNGEYTLFLRGKVTRLEHSMALSNYPTRSLDPNTIYWAFYHLYGVILRKGGTSSKGHYVCAFEQRQTGRWLFFDDTANTAEELTRSELDAKVDKMQKDEEDHWRIFMLMYRRLFHVPVRLLTAGTSSSSAIALQNQQSHEEPGEPETEDVQAEQPMPTELPTEQNVEVQADLEVSASNPDTGETRGKTQGAAEDELQGDPGDLETRGVQADQPMPTKLLMEQYVEVEADPESSASKHDAKKTPGAADDASSDRIPDVQTEQPLSTEQNFAIEGDSQSPTSKPEVGEKRSRKQAEKMAQNETQEEDENEQTPTSQSASEIVEARVEPSVQPSKKETGRKATKRTHDKALDEDEQTARSVPASKRAKTKADKSKATKRARKEASDEHEDEKAEISAPSTKRAKTNVEPSTGYGGRETRSRAAAKRARGEAPDADKIQEEHFATAKPASRAARTAKPAAQPKKTQAKSKTQRKK